MAGRGCGLTEEELEDVQAQQQQQEAERQQGCQNPGSASCGSGGCSSKDASANPAAGSWQRGGVTQAAANGQRICGKCRTAEAVVGVICQSQVESQHNHLQRVLTWIDWMCADCHSPE